MPSIWVIAAGAAAVTSTVVCVAVMILGAAGVQSTIELISSLPLSLQLGLPLGLLGLLALTTYPLWRRGFTWRLVQRITEAKHPGTVVETLKEHGANVVVAGHACKWLYERLASSKHPVSAKDVWHTAGGAEPLFGAFQAHVEHPAVVRWAAGVCTTLAADADIRQAMLDMGILPLLTAALDCHQQDPFLLSKFAMLMGVLVEDWKAGGAALMSDVQPPVTAITAAMARYPDDLYLQTWGLRCLLGCFLSNRGPGISSAFETCLHEVCHAHELAATAVDAHPSSQEIATLSTMVAAASCNRVGDSALEARAWASLVDSGLVQRLADRLSAFPTNDQLQSLVPALLASVKRFEALVDDADEPRVVDMTSPSSSRVEEVDEADTAEHQPEAKVDAAGGVRRRRRRD